MARPSYFRENGQNNPNFLMNVRPTDIKRNIKRILLDVVNDNIIEQDYIFFTNPRLVDFGIAECQYNIGYNKTMYDAAYTYSTSPQYIMSGLANTQASEHLAKIMSSSMSKIQAWSVAYNCFIALHNGNDPIAVFGNIKGSDNSILKQL